jgi:hypothetical protein
MGVFDIDVIASRMDKDRIMRFEQDQTPEDTTIFL